MKCDSLNARRYIYICLYISKSRRRQEADGKCFSLASGECQCHKFGAQAHESHIERGGVGKERADTVLGAVQSTPTGDI